jgi:branched-chain amino acid transport system ATP-binding protein
LTAIDDISFGVHTYESLGLMGPNVAGKSTLLNIISGTYKPDSGTIKFRGRNITSLASHKVCHSGIGRTFQIPQPFTNLTVLKNITVAAEYGRGLGKSIAEKEALKYLKWLTPFRKKDCFNQKSGIHNS